MKRDIQINISILEEIYRKVKTYIDALTQLEHASKDFEEAIKEQKSEAYEALSELWENDISQKESKIKWQLVIVADLLKDYINAMQEYIQPLNEAQNMRVDRDDILWNIQQINSYIYNFNWIINDDGQSWNDYSRPFVYDKSEDKETNAVRRRIQEELENQERIRRQNNYNLLAAFREELKKETSVSSYTSTIYEEMCEIEKIYDNNIVPFENADDFFAGKMKGYYDEWKSITNTVEDLTEVVYSFGRGLRQVGLDTLEDAIRMGNLLYVQELQATGQKVPEELQDDVNTYIKNLRDGISNTITDPGNTIEAIGQNIFDTVDEEGLAYAAGYIAPEVVAIALATRKIGRKNVKGSAGVVDDVLEGGTVTLKPDELIVRDSKFLDADGNIDWDTWAPNGGRVLGTIQEGQTLEVGTIIDRYGNPYGKYTSPVGVSYEQRALPYVENPNAYHKYEVIKSIDNVTISQIAEAFEQPGGGMQYELPSIVNKLIKDKLLREIK